MRSSSAIATFLIAWIASSLAVGAHIAQSTDSLPPLSYVCPMPTDADVIEDHPGKCPKCGMRLTPVRLDTTWTCPIHGAVHKDKPGTCPLDGRALIQVTMSVSWVCKETDSRALAPGRCPDGSAMAKEYAPRPHGNHNPQHGGQFFMAPDNWHHLEGTYPRAGDFRMYLYDDFTKPLPQAQLQAVAAQIVVDGRTVTLTSARGRQYLEARIPRGALPATIEASVRFTKDTRPNVFDFTFASYSANPTTPAPIVTPTVAAAPPVANAPASVRVATSTATGAAVASSSIEAVTLTQTIPGTVPAILAVLRTRTDQIRSLIDKGLFGEVYVPAFEAKDLAVALESHQSEALPARRQTSEAALSTLVRDAYLLDAFGDLGNKQQISDAFAEFSAAVTDIQTSFPPEQP